MQEEIYVSIDVEADGPCPGVNSMLSFGAVPFSLTKGQLSNGFYRNLNLLPTAVQNPDTMKFWADNQSMYDRTRVSTTSPESAMTDFNAWLRFLPGKPIAVAYPAGFDFTFIYWYFHKFLGHSPFGFSALDVKSYAAGHMGYDFKYSTKKNYPRNWFGKTKHNHDALDDAREQGEMFINILKEVKAKGG